MISGKWAAEEEHEEDEEVPATEAGGSEGSNESVSTDSHELPVLQASDGEEDNERSERLFGYNPDNGDVWGEYQAVMGDPMLAW